MSSLDELIRWADDARVPWQRPAVRSVDEFRDNHATDFGRLVVRPPAVVLVPRAPGDLAASMRVCAARRIPYKLRGAGHSSGGQVLIEGGVVIDLSRMSGIVDHGDAIDVLGGTTWLEVVELLHPRRRPPVLTDNLRTTIAGTLAVGGVGDTSIHEGLQIEHVIELDWIAPDGSLRTLTHGDEELGFLLAGRGQLGAIARARIAVMPCLPLLAGHVAAWTSLDDYLEAAALIRRDRLFEVVRATLFWRADGSSAVRAIVANGVDHDAQPPTLDDPLLARLRPTTSAVIAPSDRFVAQRADPIASWGYVCPALEFSLPLDEDGRAAWRMIEARIRSSGLDSTLPAGIAVAVLAPASPGLPLAPLPPGREAMFFALRPQLATAADATRWIPVLQELAASVLAAGGRIYLMSIEIESEDFLEQQFGAALPRLRELKRKHDPGMVCNPWLL